MVKRGLSESAFDYVPIYYLPDGVEIVGPAISVVDVVGVLPNIYNKQGIELVAQGRCGVVGREQHQSVVAVLGEPHPARAEEGHCGFVEVDHELVKRAKIVVNEGFEAVGRGLLGGGRESLEEECVIPHLSGIVEQRALGIFDNFHQRAVLKTGVLHQIVGLVYIPFQVFVVVVVHGFEAQVGRKGVEMVVQMWHCGHGFVVCTHSRIGLFVVLLDVLFPFAKQNMCKTSHFSEMFFVPLWLLARVSLNVSISNHLL